MQQKIGRKIYDTEKATNIGSKIVGEFGQPDGFEEKLYVTEDGKFFLYGAGGGNSPYSDPSIQLLTTGQANKWKKIFSLK